MSSTASNDARLGIGRQRSNYTICGDDNCLLPQWRHHATNFTVTATRSFDLSDKMDGRVIGHTSYQISDDGQTLTAVVP